MPKFNIGQNFSPDPSGRFYSDGDASGEEFREDYLKDLILALSDGEKLTILLDDGVEGYGSSFLSEGFAGLVKYGYITADDLANKIEITYSDLDFEFFEKRIYSYIKSARYDSKAYKPTPR
jgi:hypothetical protein